MVGGHGTFLSQRHQDSHPGTSWQLHCDCVLSVGLSGVAILLLAIARAGLARAIALCVAGANLLILSQDIYSVDLGIDRLLFDQYVITDATSPGRIPPQTAVGLIAACVAIVLVTRRRPIHGRSFILAGVGSMVVAIGVVSLVGYSTGFEQAYGWGRFTKISVQAAVSFVALGAAIFSLGWAEARAMSPGTPRWLAAPVAIGVATMSILFCQALLSYEDRQIDFAVRTDAAAAQQEIESELAASVAVIDRTARRWETSGRPEQTRWQSNAGLNFDDATLLQAIEWVDPSYRARWVVPAPVNAWDVGFNFGGLPELRPVLVSAERERRTIVSRPIDRGRGDQEVFVVAPIYIGDTFGGFVVGILRVNDMFEIVLNDRVSPAASIAVYDGHRHIFERSVGDSAADDGWSVDVPVMIHNAQLTMRVWPGNVTQQRTLLPYGALFIGFVVAGLLGLVTYLLQQAGERARAIQYANDALQVEVVERTRAEAELRHSTGALERSNRSLQEFAYVASHDLKAPLVSLQGLAAMLQDDIGASLTDDARLYLDRIVVNATRMRNLLDDLLELARVGREDAPVNAVDLRGVIDGVSGQLQQILNERDAQVIVHGSLPVVAANPVRLQQVFSNLIDNALKYTPTERAPRIEIAATDDGDFWQVTVRDNGAGVPPEYREKIFTMFQRLPKGRTMNPTGTGMGLAIVSRIVEANGGRCWIAASDQDGTTLCLTFPKPAAHHLNQPPRARQPVGAS